MRALIVLAAVVLLLAIVGWVSFNNEPGRASIHVETEEIRQDTQQVLKASFEALQNAGEAVESQTGGDNDGPSPGRRDSDDP